MLKGTINEMFTVSDVEDSVLEASFPVKQQLKVKD